MLGTNKRTKRRSEVRHYIFYCHFIPEMTMFRIYFADEWRKGKAIQQLDPQRFSRLGSFKLFVLTYGRRLSEKEWRLYKENSGYVLLCVVVLDGKIFLCVCKGSKTTIVSSYVLHIVCFIHRLCYCILFFREGLPLRAEF